MADFRTVAFHHINSKWRIRLLDGGGIGVYGRLGEAAVCVAKTSKFEEDL